MTEGSKTEALATVAATHDASEVLSMLTDENDLDIYGDEEAEIHPASEDDTVFGRMPVGSGGDEDTDFDVLPQRIVDIRIDDVPSIPIDDLYGDEPPAVFKSPSVAAVAEEFPILNAALKKARDDEDKPQVVRIDTPKTYDAFVCERAVKEIERRLNELRSSLESHLEEHEHERHPGYGHETRKMRQWDEILGAAEIVDKIKSARTTEEAAAALPQVPLDIPPFAEGKIRCWRDGESIVCSIKFQAADGTGRIATMTAKPQTDLVEVAGWAMRRGVDPVTILGVLPDVAETRCAKRLMKDVVGAALKAQRRLDVCGMLDERESSFLTELAPLANMEEPILIVGAAEDEAPAPVVALAEVQQRANGGDVRAQREMGKIRAAAATPKGKKIAGPILAQADKRVAVVSAVAPVVTFAQRYAQMGLVL